MIHIRLQLLECASNGVTSLGLGHHYKVIDNWTSGGCFTNLSQVLQNILLKFVHCRNHASYENFELKLCTPKAKLWAHVQSLSLKFSPKIWFLILYIFVRLFWRAFVSQPFVKHQLSPGSTYPIAQWPGTSKICQLARWFGSSSFLNVIKSVMDYLNLASEKFGVMWEWSLSQLNR